VTQLVNRLRGIGPLNSRIFVAAVFTTAFAGLAYVFPEIFGEWFANYLGGPFVLLGVSNILPLGLADDVVRKAGRVTARGVNEVTFVRRIHNSFKAAGMSEEAATAATNAAIRDLYELVELRGYSRLSREIHGAGADPGNLGHLTEARVARGIGAENIEGLEVRFNTHRIDILAHRDPLTGRRAIIEVKDMTDRTNVERKLFDQLPELRTFDPGADMVVYVRSGQVSQIQAYCDATFSFPVIVRAIEGT